MDAGEVIIPVTLFVATAITFILFRKFTNDERLALIEKGGDANIFNKKPNFTFIGIKTGLLLFGGGLGVLLGNLLEKAGIMEIEPAVFACIMIFGGLGLFSSYFVEKKLTKKESDSHE